MRPSIKRVCIDQIHKQFTVEQVRVLLKGYLQGTVCDTTLAHCGYSALSREEIAFGESMSFKLMKLTPSGGKPMRILGVDVAYVLSIEAKGKVERYHRWLYRLGSYDLCLGEAEHH